MIAALIACAVVAPVIWALCRISALSWRDEEWIGWDDMRPRRSTRNQTIRQRKALRAANQSLRGK